MCFYLESVPQPGPNKCSIALVSSLEEAGTPVALLCHVILAASPTVCTSYFSRDVATWAPALLLAVRPRPGSPTIDSAVVQSLVGLGALSIPGQLLGSWTPQYFLWNSGDFSIVRWKVGSQGQVRTFSQSTWVFIVFHKFFFVCLFSFFFFFFWFGRLTRLDMPSFNVAIKYSWKIYPFVLEYKRKREKNTWFTPTDQLVLMLVNVYYNILFFCFYALLIYL